MPSLTDPELLRSSFEALEEWNCDGYIEWKPRPRDWLRENLGNFTQKAVGRLMYEYVLAGGEIDQVEETREEYRDTDPFHYDFRLGVASRLIYVETVLRTSRMGPTILVVSIHDA